MKILFVTHWANNMLIFRIPLLTQAVAQGHEVMVLCPNDPEAEEFSQLQVRHIPWSLQRAGGFLNLAHAIKHAYQIIKTEKPDRVVVYCVQPIIAILGAWSLVRPKAYLYPVFTGLGSLWTETKPLTIKRRLARYLVEFYLGCLLPMAKNIFVLNRDDLKQVEQWNSNKLLGKVKQTLGEGVDLALFKPAGQEQRLSARKEWDIPQDAYVIGFVGRLIKEKGIDVFLSLCRFYTNDQNTHFLCVGSADQGNPSSLSQKEIQELESIPRMHHVAWLSDVRPAYAAMDVLTFFSQREGLPITPLEAMSMGVPVIALDAIGTREIDELHFVTGDDIYEGILKMRSTNQSSYIDLTKWDRQTIQRNFLDSVILG